MSPHFTRIHTGLTVGLVIVWMAAQLWSQSLPVVDKTDTGTRTGDTTTCSISGVASSVSKTIFVAATPTPPVIDGVLDDPCWQNTEVRDDFHARTTMAGRPTRLRLAFDAATLYIGLECDWDDAAALEAAVLASHEQHGEPNADIVPFAAYGFAGPSLELYIDPGRTRENYECVFVNAVGQWTGWFKYHVKQFDQFKLDRRVVYRSHIAGRTWTAEIAYPFAGLRTGDEWGFNVGRNDEGPGVAVWSETGVSWHDPGRFGTLYFGSIPAWMESTWERHAPEKAEAGMRQLADQTLNRPWLAMLHASLVEQATALQSLTRGTMPTNRTGFDAIQADFMKYRNTYGRLLAAQNALLLTVPPASPGNTFTIQQDNR